MTSGAKFNNEDKVKLFIAAMRRSECTSLEETGKAVQGIVDDHLFSYFHPDDGSKVVNPKLPSYVQILTKAKAHFARQQLTLEQEASKGGKAVKAKEKAKPKDKGSGGKEVNQTANGVQSAQGGGKGKGKKNGKGKGKGGHSGDSGKGPKGGKGGTRTAVCLICNGDHLFSWNNNGVPFHSPEEQKRFLDSPPGRAYLASDAGRKFASKPLGATILAIKSQGSNLVMPQGIGWGAPPVGVPMLLPAQPPPPLKYSGGAADEWSPDKEQQYQKLVAERQQKSAQYHQAGGGWPIDGGRSPGWNSSWYPPGGGGGGPPPGQGGGWSPDGLGGGGGGFKMPGN